MELHVDNDSVALGFCNSDALCHVNSVLLSNGAMYPIGEIRRWNLGVLKERYGSWAELNVALARNRRDATFGQIWNRSPDSKTGKPREMGTSQARAIEKALGLSPNWLDTPIPPKAPVPIGYEGPETSEAPPPLPRFLRASDDDLKGIPVPTGRRIPVVGHARLGDNGHFVELEHPTGHGDGYIDLPSNDPNAYALRCVGDSMTPRVRNGEFVIVEPNHPVSPGDEVLVKAADGRVMVKQYLYRRDGRVHLLSVNEAHPPIALAEADVEAMHYVGAITKASRWVTG